MSDVPTSSDTLTDLGVDVAVEPPSPQRVPVFSVIIPAYNEEAAIESTLNHLIEQFASRNCEYEIIVVNDGSNDLTGEVLARRQDVCVRAA